MIKEPPQLNVASVPVSRARIGGARYPSKTINGHAPFFATEPPTIRLLPKADWPHPSEGVSKRPLIWPFGGAAFRNFGAIGISDGVNGSTNGGNGILRDSASPRAHKK